MALILELADLLKRMNLDITTMAAGAQATYMTWLIGVDRAVKDYCKWNINLISADTQYYSGNGASDLPVRTPYIKNDSTLAVYLDMTGYGGQNTAGAFASSTLLTKGSAYMLRLEADRGKSGLLVKLPGSGTSSGFWPWMPSSSYYRGRSGLSWNQGSYWPIGNGNIKVVCNYGFDYGEIPEDIRVAVAMGVAMVRNLVQRGVFVTGESLGDYSWSGQMLNLMPFASITSFLNKWRDTII